MGLLQESSLIVVGKRQSYAAYKSVSLTSTFYFYDPDCQSSVHNLYDLINSCISFYLSACTDKATWCYSIQVAQCSRTYYNKDWCCSTCHRLTATAGQMGKIQFDLKK